MARNQSASPTDFPRRRLYAFVDESETIGEGKRARTSFLFDCIDADAFDNNREAWNHQEAFAQLRIVTTKNRIRSFAGSVPTPADWWEIEIAPRIKAGIPQGLPTWHFQLVRNQYSQVSNGVTIHLRRLGGPDDIQPRRSVGAAATPAIPVSILLSTFSLSRLPSVSFTSRLRAIQKPVAVKVFDVGQANMTALVDCHNIPLLMVDAGLPNANNRHTRPRHTSIPNLRKAPPVLLTHWHWDHLSAALEWPIFRTLMWIAPDRPIGPGKARVARILARKRKLGLWRGPRASFAFGSVLPCTGAVSDINSSGLAVIASLPTGQVLMPGDADYELIPPSLRMRFHGLVVTHHGGHFNGPCVPAGSRNSLAVISVGAGNGYRHPSAASINAHTKAGWRLQQTARSHAQPRGHRIIR